MLWPFPKQLHNIKGVSILHMSKIRLNKYVCLFNSLLRAPGERVYLVGPVESAFCDFDDERGVGECHRLEVGSVLAKTISDIQ